MILVECYKDQELMYRIGFTPDQVDHELGRSRVLARMDNEQKAVAVVDEDPRSGEPEYLQGYAERDVAGKIRVLAWKRDHKKRVIQISPYLEEWLYGVAGRNRISPESFGLPTDPEKLHAMSLRPGKNMQNFQRFVDALRDTKDDEINTLKEWIREAMAE